MIKVRKQFELASGGYHDLDGQLRTLETALRARGGTVLSVIRVTEGRSQKATVRYEIPLKGR